MVSSCAFYMCPFLCRLGEIISEKLNSRSVKKTSNQAPSKQSILPAICKTEIKTHIQKKDTNQMNELQAQAK